MIGGHLHQKKRPSLLYRNIFRKNKVDSFNPDLLTSTLKDFGNDSLIAFLKYKLYGDKNNSWGKGYEKRINWKHIFATKEYPNLLYSDVRVTMNDTVTT